MRLRCNKVSLTHTDQVVVWGIQISGALAIVPIMLDQRRRKMERIRKMNQEKPPAQTVTMESIEPAPIVFGGGIDLKHDWYKLLNCAPFQMYCTEVTGNASADVEDWIAAFVESEILAGREDALFKAYGDWHGAKGYWKKETVYGDLI